MMSKRPSVDVVVPFAGPADELAELVAKVAGLSVRDADSLTIVDNRPRGSGETPDPGSEVRLVRARERRSSYFARNSGAALGDAQWLLFVDADVEAPADLLERYFQLEAAADTGVLAGGVVDEPPPQEGRRRAAARFALLQASMSQDNTLLDGPWAYAQTANCAVRRTAFEEVGGFREELRSGGDADLCFRLRAAGWGLERRSGAIALHRTRSSLVRMLRQRARHGSGAAWLDREYPGAFPRERWLGLAKWTVQSLGAAAMARARGDRDGALISFVEPLSVWAFELGRLFPNEVAKR